MRKKPVFTLILPCFNERVVFDKSVKLILQTLNASKDVYEVIFVDDGSTDGTRDRIVAVCKKYPQCRYVFHPVNMGRGAAVMTGIRAAKGRIVGYIDIDCEVSPLYIPLCTEMIARGDADVVVGRRIYRTGWSSFIREVLSVGYRWIATGLLETGGIDTESGYKFFNKKKCLPMLKRIDAMGWFWDTESIVFARRAGLQVEEVPVLFLRRTDKQSSVKLVSDTIAYIGSSWRLYRRLHNHQ